MAKPLALGDIVDELGPILWSAKALEIALRSNAASSGERFVADALSDLAMSLADLPGLDDLAAALITLADELDGDPDLEPEDDCDGEEEGLPLFAFAGLTRPP